MCRKQCLELESVSQAPSRHKPREGGGLPLRTITVAVTARRIGEAGNRAERGGTGDFYKSSQVRRESQESGM